MKNNLKKTFLLLLTMMLVLSLSLTGCGGGQEASEGGDEAYVEPITITLPHIYGEGHPTGIALEDFFKKEVESRSNGSLIVEIYGGGNLANEEQIYEGIRNGTYQMAMMGIIFQDTKPLVTTFQLPFLFEDFDHAKEALYDNEYGMQLLANTEDLGFKCLNVNPDGFRIMTLNKKIEDMAGFNGFKLRTANFENMIKMGELLGATVTPMAMTEVFSALEQKVVDGQENPPSTIKAAGWYEIQDYMMLSNHVFSPNFTCVNLKFWDSLTDEQRQIITDVSNEMSGIIWDAAKVAAEADIEEMAQAGIEVYSPSDEFRQDMIEATQPLYQDLYKKAPEAEAIVEGIQSLR